MYSEITFVFLFDHSCGHDRQRPDGLNMKRMNKLFGGSQPRMRDSLIKAPSYLGPHTGTHSLDVGDYQHMTFSETDSGPFYLTDAERKGRRKDRDTGQSATKKKNRKQLIQDLKNVNVMATGNMKTVTRIAKAHDIELSYSNPIIEEGWEGKPKGILQILYERGYIDPKVENPLRYYTMEGRKDGFGNTRESTSLIKLMGTLLDFLEEETLLQYHGRTLGVVADRTPKCHPEMAGEGIEYAWGAAKGVYRRLPMKRKRGKRNFVSL